jgi:hypothetical protein
VQLHETRIPIRASGGKPVLFGGLFSRHEELPNFGLNDDGKQNTQERHHHS